MSLEFYLTSSFDLLCFPIFRDINAFLNSHSVEEATENIEAIRKTLAKCLPGGESNIKSMYLKSTNLPAIPIYVNDEENPNKIHLPNNVVKK